MLIHAFSALFVLILLPSVASACVVYYPLLLTWFLPPGIDFHLLDVFPARWGTNGALFFIGLTVIVMFKVLVFHHASGLRSYTADFGFIAANALSTVYGIGLTFLAFFVTEYGLAIIVVIPWLTLLFKCILRHVGHGSGSSRAIAAALVTVVCGLIFKSLLFEWLPREGASGVQICGYWVAKYSFYAISTGLTLIIGWVLEVAAIKHIATMDSRTINDVEHAIFWANAAMFFIFLFVGAAATLPERWTACGGAIPFSRDFFILPR